MADDIVTITFQNDLLTDNSGGSVTLAGSIRVDYTTNSYSGNYSLTNANGRYIGQLANSGGLQNSVGQYTLTDGVLTVSYVGEMPSRFTSATYVQPTFGGLLPSDTYSANDQPLGSTPCYAEGTLIRTSNGDIPVEQLAIGDLVVTASGAHRVVRWLGRRGYSGPFANRNPDVLPVCFAVGSLGDGLPARDLFVSPKHAMLIDGVLVAAEHLVNGSTITKATRVDRIDYFHVELGSHDVLLAEGAPSESFVNDEGRMHFHNAAEFATLYPDHQEPAETAYCAPRVEDGYALEAIRARLAGRAAAAA